MSSLYCSPELLALNRRCHGSLDAARIGTPNRRHCSIPQRFAARRCQQRRVPHQPGTRRRPHQVIPPAKTSTGFSREFSSAISGFRSLCGRKRRSSVKPSRSKRPAFWNLSPGAGSRFENSGLHRIAYGASNPGPMSERSRSRAIFQVVFLRFNRALSGRFSPRHRPRNASQIGLWSPLQS